jgi:hypothetical protein
MGTLRYNVYYGNNEIYLKILFLKCWQNLDNNGFKGL